MELRVSVDEKARQYISKKGNVLTVSSVSFDNCCVPINEVLIQYKKPEHLHMFHEIKNGSITILVDKNLEFKNHFLKIRHAGFGLLQTVQVDGIVRF